MIGKIARSGSDFLGVLTYCKYERSTKTGSPGLKERGELLHHQQLDAFLIDDDAELGLIATELQRVAARNARTKKPVCHVSLSFPPGEDPPPDVLRSIVLDFAREFGLSENALLAYQHRDKRHGHLHIIASKIDANGRNTFRSSFNYLSMGHFCRQVEHRYGLQKVKQMDALKIDGKRNPKESQHHEGLRNLIDGLLLQSGCLEQLRRNLLENGYKTRVGNGITFIHMGTGVRIKGSDLGRGYSHQNLEKRIRGCYVGEASWEKSKPDPTETQKLRSLIRTWAPQSSDFDDFVRKLNRQGYGVIRREKTNPKSTRRYTTLFFSKEFSGREANQQAPRPKIISGYKLGPEFSHSAILKNLNRAGWEGSGPGDRALDPYPPVSPPAKLGLESLFTSTNARRVEDDAGRSGKRQPNRTDLEGRSEEEKRTEEHRIRKDRRPRRFG